MSVRKILTLHIEDNTLRLLTARRRRVLQWLSVPLGPQSIQQGLIRDPANIGTKIADHLSELKVSRNRVVASISDHRVISRVITIPAVEKKLLSGTVRRKAKQELAMPLEESDLAWHVLSRNEQEIEILFIATPKQLMDRYVEALRHARIRPWVMDVKSLALARVANRLDAVLINLEPQSIGVTILVNGVPSFVRSVPLSAATLSTPEAGLDLLIQEFQRTTNYFNESHQDRPLASDTPVFVTGLGFENPQALERFRAGSSNPVSLPEPPLVMPPDLPIAEYSVNLGLVLRMAG